MPGLFANAQIKKRKYWPKHVPIKEIEGLLEKMDIGDWGVYIGTYLGKPVFIIFVKDELWNSLYMAAFCPNGRGGPQQVRCGGAITFQNPLNKASYLEGRPYVDHANQGKQKGDCALEKSFKTHRIAVRDWTGDVAQSESNGFWWWNTHEHPAGDPEHDSTFRGFRMQSIYEDLLRLADKGVNTGRTLFTADAVNLLFKGSASTATATVAEEASDFGPLHSAPAAPNSDDDGAGPAKKRARLHVPPVMAGGVAHVHVSLPKGHCNAVQMLNGEPVFDEANGVHNFDPVESKNKYPSYRCSYPTCKRRVRMYCKCDQKFPQKTMMCSTHFAAHVLELSSA